MIGRVTHCFHFLNNNLEIFKMLDLSVEFPQLKDEIYLDHSGSALPSKSMLDNWRLEISETVFGNPHSKNSPAALASTNRINHVRSRIKRY